MVRCRCLRALLPPPRTQGPPRLQIPFTDIYKVAKQNYFLNRKFNSKDWIYVAWMVAMHGLALFAPATFSWEMVALFFGTYFVTGCLGITLSYHRQLSHRSFKTPKWLEYTLAYCGVLAIQGDPIEWASAHRYHHLHTDTPLDPHSPYEGFWWSHMGWLLDNEKTMERVSNKNNAMDLIKQPFYQFLEKTYMWHIGASFLALYLIGGFPAVVWGGALRAVWVYHITWAVNSVVHCWGEQPYETGDLSVNNALIGVLAWGEGWHNNHHKYEFSARHGLEWWQVDITWCVSTWLFLGTPRLGIRLPFD